MWLRVTARVRLVIWVRVIARVSDRANVSIRSVSPSHVAAERATL